MKNRRYPYALLALVISIIGFTACKDDKPIPDWPTPNELLYGDRLFILNQAMVRELEPIGDETPIYEVALFTEGIVMTDEGEPKNEGTIIYFYLQPIDSEDLTTGQYQFSSEAAPGSITSSSLIIDYSSDAVLPLPTFKMRDGVFSIKKVGHDHAFNFTLSAENTITVQGSFQGPIAYIKRD